MSEPVPPASRAAVVNDVLVVLAAAAVLGIAAGFLWPQLADPVTVVRTGDGLVRDEVALAEKFDAEGWYTVLAAAGGLLLGLVMMAWRRTDALVTLLAVVAGAFVAAWLSAQIGLGTGPDDPTEALSEAAEGTTAPAALALSTEAVYWVWPLAAVLGSLLYLLSPLSERPIAETHPQGDVSAPGDEAPPPRP